MFFGVLSVSLITTAWFQMEKTASEYEEWLQTY
jgi:hypothetical protein